MLWSVLISGQFCYEGGDRPLCSACTTPATFADHKQDSGGVACGQPGHRPLSFPLEKSQYCIYFILLYHYIFCLHGYKDSLIHRLSNKWRMYYIYTCVFTCSPFLCFWSYILFSEYDTCMLCYVCNTMYMCTIMHALSLPPSLLPSSLPPSLAPRPPSPPFPSISLTFDRMLLFIAVSSLRSWALWGMWHYQLGSTSRRFSPLCFGFLERQLKSMSMWIR